LVCGWPAIANAPAQRYEAARTHLVELRREMLQKQEANISEEELKSKLDNVQVSKHWPLPHRFSFFGIRARGSSFSAHESLQFLPRPPFVPM
jgi:hypothetical protein